MLCFCLPVAVLCVISLLVCCCGCSCAATRGSNGPCEALDLVLLDPRFCLACVFVCCCCVRYGSFRSGEADARRAASPCLRRTALGEAASGSVPSARCLAVFWGFAAAIFRTPSRDELWALAAASRGPYCLLLDPRREEGGLGNPSGCEEGDERIGPG